ncbi:DUF805 domain-containing protein [uncultured Eubacterium sp.]|uniref:DUF805 domain-containing protein n=1 Tax=uncultured Eubacterium sp. TaxID=165185 RepID=UPI0025F58B60|nr:DUF805 domain-containing protein [uncultured Eubacterium sp.]MCI6536129.1 DUF805 domain-containing protein [Lachnospiraceae bacterium]
MSKTCKKCGLVWADDAQYCENCGNPLQESGNFGETVVLSDMNNDYYMNEYENRNSNQNGYDQQYTKGSYDSPAQNGYQESYQQQPDFQQQSQSYNGQVYEQPVMASQNIQPSAGMSQKRTAQRGGYDKGNGLMGSYRAYWKNIVNFKDRTRRKDFWQVWLMNILISVLFFILKLIPVLGIVFGIISLVYTIACILPQLAMSVRRLHDSGKSGFLLLLALIPIVGGIIVLIFFLQDSEPGENKYGRNPKEIV